MVGVAVVEPILLHFWFATLWRQEPRQEVLKLDSPEQKLQVARVITAVYFLCFYVCLRRWRVNLFSADAYIAMPLGAAATAAVSIVFLVRALVTERQPFDVEALDEIKNAVDWLRVVTVQPQFWGVLASAVLATSAALDVVMGLLKVSSAEHPSDGLGLVMNALFESVYFTKAAQREQPRSTQRTMTLVVNLLVMPGLVLFVFWPFWMPYNTARQNFVKATIESLRTRVDFLH